MSISGPLAICQLLESTFLNLSGYASLLASNAARMRICAGKQKELLEFGLRRSQGADGAMSAARYAYLGGFDSTSNVSKLDNFEIIMVVLTGVSSMLVTILVLIGTHFVFEIGDKRFVCLFVHPLK